MTFLRFLVSLVYSVVGFSGFVAFICLKNYAAAVLAILTGLINLVSCHVNFLNHNKKLQEWYSPLHLEQISTLGFGIFAFSTSILVYFTVTEILEKKPILPIHDSAIIPIIWALIALKSGLLLLWFASSYGGNIDNQRLLNDEESNGETSNQNVVIEPEHS